MTAENVTKYLVWNWECKNLFGNEIYEGQYKLKYTEGRHSGMLEIPAIDHPAGLFCNNDVLCNWKYISDFYFAFNIVFITLLFLY